MTKSTETLMNIYFFVTLISIITAILSIRYTLRLRSYLEEFIKVSNKVANKEFHVRMNVLAKGELGNLEKNFNNMIEKMEVNIEELEYKHLQVKSILKSISHGILAIDINGNIILINEEAKRIIKSDSNGPIEGHNISYVIKENKILKEILKFTGSKENKKIQIKTNEDIFYKINLDPIYLQNNSNIIIGTIINIEDITEKVKLENMRTDFVANVSHELKTPLTSISGFVETLRSNADIDFNTRDRFLEIIENESDRLKRLIEDILLLSFIENKDDVYRDKVNLQEVYNEVKEMTSYSSKNKNISVNEEFKDGPIIIDSNRDYIKQIFLNLMDNAIKYTQDNGSVNVMVYKKDENINIVVRDNGIGIDKDDMERVFERFYRVDKARSRDVGGTGLGLAITKHIIKYLNGTISVKSELGYGSEFIVTIPL